MSEVENIIEALSDVLNVINNPSAESTDLEGCRPNLEQALKDAKSLKFYAPFEKLYAALVKRITDEDARCLSRDLEDMAYYLWAMSQFDKPTGSREIKKAALTKAYFKIRMFESRLDTLVEARLIKMELSNDNRKKLYSITTLGLEILNSYGSKLKS